MKKKLLAGFLAFNLLTTGMPIEWAHAETLGNIEEFVEQLGGKECVSCVYDEENDTYTITLLKDLVISDGASLSDMTSRVVIDFDGYFAYLTGDEGIPVRNISAVNCSDVVFKDAGGIIASGMYASALGLGKTNFSILVDRDTPHKVDNDKKEGVPIFKAQGEDSLATIFTGVASEVIESFEFYIEDAYVSSEKQTGIQIADGRGVIDNLTVDGYFGGISYNSKIASDSLVINNIDAYSDNKKDNIYNYGSAIAIGEGGEHEATVIINGGKFVGGGECINCQGGKLYINDGDFYGGVDALYSCNSTAVVNDGTYKGVECGIYNGYAGNVTVNGGSFTAEDEDGAAVTSIWEEGSVTITGGTFTNENAIALASYNTDVYVTGGTFTGKYGMTVYVFTEEERVEYGYPEKINNKVVIEGGIFKGTETGISFSQADSIIKGGNIIGGSEYGVELFNGVAKLYGGTISGGKNNLKLEQANEAESRVYLLENDVDQCDINLETIRLVNPDQMSIIQVSNKLLEDVTIESDSDKTFTPVEHTNYSIWNNTGADKMEEVTPSYSVTYNLNGGENSPFNPAKVFEGKSYTLYPATKSGAIFKGWFSDVQFENPVEEISEPTADITLYAKFEATVEKKSQIASYVYTQETMASEPTYQVEFNIVEGNTDKSTYEYSVIKIVGEDPIATIDENGLLTLSKKAGTIHVNIKVPAVDGYYSAEYLIIVNVKRENATIAIDGFGDEENASYNVTECNDPFKIKVGAKVENMGDVDGKFEFASLDPEVATIDENGVVTINKKGNAAFKITLLASDYSDMALRYFSVYVGDVTVSAPAIDVAVGNDGKASVTWTKAEALENHASDWSLKGYKLYKSTDGKNFKLLKETTACEFTESVKNATCYYKVKAYDTNGDGQFSNVVKVSHLSPVSITEVDTTSAGVTISWEKNVAATEYEVYRAAGADSPKVLATVKGTSYFDKSSKDNGEKYSYTVVAKNAETKSVASNAVSSYYIAAVNATKATNKSKSVAIAWNKNDKASGYNIFRSKNGGSFEKLATVSKSATTSYEDESAVNGTSYEYKVVPFLKADGVEYTNGDGAGVKAYRLNQPAFTTAKNIKGKKLQLKWKKNTKASGYEIKYVTGNKTKTVKITKASTISKTISKLKKKKSYKVTIRSFKTLDKKKYYSAWSKSKTIKIKK